MRRSKSKNSIRRGQALVEFALVLPLLLILTMLIIQYGIIFYTTIGITNLSREGARFAATQPSSDAAIETRIQNVTPANINYSDLSINITPAETIAGAPNPARATGSNALISVQITYDMRKKLFLPSTFLGVTVFSQTFSSTTKMMVE